MNHADFTAHAALQQRAAQSVANARPLVRKANRWLPERHQKQQ